MTEIKICKCCGCMEWDESETKTISTHYWIDKLELKAEDNNSELLGEDIINRCSECDNEDLEEIDLEGEELKEVVNMGDDERLDWLKKYLVMQGVKNA